MVINEVGPGSSGPDPPRFVLWSLTLHSEYAH